MSEKEIRQIAKAMEELGLTEISSEESAFWGLFKSKKHLSKQQFCATNAAIHSGNNIPQNSPMPQKPQESVDVAGAITSPMVGIAYLAPEPNAKPFVEVGKSVNAGDTLCLIEAMKTFNPVKAVKAGVVAEILVNDGDTVEYGTPLVIVK